MDIFAPKNAFFSTNRPCWLIYDTVGWLVGVCGAPAVSRRTPIYFMIVEWRSKFADGKSIKLVKLRLVACRGIGFHGNPKMTQIICALVF